MSKKEMQIGEWYKHFQETNVLALNAMLNMSTDLIQLKPHAERSKCRLGGILLD